MICLGIESTAHTFGVGLVDMNKQGKFSILSDARDIYRPTKGGIHPIEAKKHHEDVKDGLLKEALQKANLGLKDIDMIAYSAGPGLPPCLKVGAELAKELGTKTDGKVFACNHPVGHIEIGRALTGCKDPIVIYVSGGNTQIIGYSSKRYRVFGETEDIAIGNAIDTFMRDAFGNAGFGGPVMEKLSVGGNYIELPYVVKGMDLSFSGIMTAAVQKWEKESKNMTEKEKELLKRDLCFSFQETCYAMLTEVTERALAHTGKNEVMLTGGVAASKRLTEMLDIMCRERGAKFFVCPKEYTGDNGSNISIVGLLMYSAGCKPINIDKINFDPKWRADDVEILWVGSE